MEDNSSPLNMLLGSAIKLGTPFLQKFAYGGQLASEQDLRDESNFYNSLNGSGASDPRGQRRRATSQEDFIFGRGGSDSAQAVRTSGVNTNSIIMMILVGLLVVLLGKSLIK